MRSLLYGWLYAYTVDKDRAAWHFLQQTVYLWKCKDQMFQILFKCLKTNQQHSRFGRISWKEHLAFYAIQNLLKKLKIRGIVWQKSVTILVMGKSAKLFLISLSQQITAGEPKALRWFSTARRRGTCSSLYSSFSNV